MSSRPVTAPRAAPGVVRDPTVDSCNRPVARPRVLPSLRSRRQLVRLAAAVVAALLLLGA